MHDFSQKTLNLLASDGVRIVGVQAIPDMSSDMPYANAERGYVIDDKGVGRVWRHCEVLGRAAAISSRRVLNRMKINRRYV